MTEVVLSGDDACAASMADRARTIDARCKAYCRSSVSPPVVPSDGAAIPVALTPPNALRGAAGENPHEIAKVTTVKIATSTSPMCPPDESTTMGASP